MKPELSVVACLYNQAGYLKGVLSSLAAQDLDESRYEVIVVDNNSTDGSLELAERFASGQGNFRVVTE